VPRSEVGFVVGAVSPVRLAQRGWGLPGPGHADDKRRAVRLSQASSLRTRMGNNWRIRDFARSPAPDSHALASESGCARQIPIAAATHLELCNDSRDAIIAEALALQKKPLVDPVGDE